MKTLDKLLWLLNKIDNASKFGGITRKQIEKDWISKYDEESYPRRTFNNHKETITELFGIEIKCDRENNKYYLEEGACDKNARIEWLRKSYAVEQMLKLSKEQLSGRIDIEEIPSGNMYFDDILDAMKHNYVVKLLYQSNKRSNPKVYIIDSFALKESENRWYVIGRVDPRFEVHCDSIEIVSYKKKLKYSEEIALRTFSLDRIKGLEILKDNINDKPYSFDFPQHFNIEEISKSAYNVYMPKIKAFGDRVEVLTKPDVILFRTDEMEAKYINQLKIHSSQKEITEEKARELVNAEEEVEIFDNYAGYRNRYFTMTIASGYDTETDEKKKFVSYRGLVLDFLSRADGVEVLKPKTLRDDIKKEVHSTYKMYFEENF